MNKQYIGVTHGVSCTGNLAALNLSLLSVLMGDALPGKMMIRLEGHFPAFANFYLEQIAELARFKGVEFSITVGESFGIRAAKDWLIDHCTTPLLWIVDDDVVVTPKALGELMEAFPKAVKLENRSSIGFINGVKADLNNRRGYADFSKARRSESELVDGALSCFTYWGDSKTVRSLFMDGGHVMLQVDNLRAKKVRFSNFDKSYCSSGDDVLFGLLCYKAGLKGFFCSGAEAYHLEKDGPSLSEFAARKNMLLRECALLGIDPDPIFRLMPWVK